MSFDLSKLSDEELDALEKKEMAKRNGGIDLSLLSDEELDKLEAQALAKQNAPTAMEAAGVGLRKGVSFGFSPVIAGAGGAAGAFLGTLDSGRSFGEAIDAGKRGFLDERQIEIDRQKAASEAHPGAAMAGEIGGMALTLPFAGARGLKGVAGVGAAQGVGNAASTSQSWEEAAVEIPKQAAIGGLAGAVSYGVLKGADKLGSAAINSKVGQKATAVGKKALALPGKVTTKVASALTGISEQEIKTFATQTDKVNAIIKRSGGDLTEETDTLRRNLQNAIRSKRQQLNGEISQALKESSDEPILNAIPALEELRKVKMRLNPRLQGDDIAVIDDLISKIRGETQGGLGSVKNLFDLKDYLQTKASSAYMKDGQVFMVGKEAQQAAKAAAAVIRKELNKASPEIAKANNTLSLLHSLESKLNKNLIKEGASDSALLSAGAGRNPRNARMLQRLGQFTDTNPLAEAQLLSTAKTFGNVSLNPLDQTGKAAARMALGGTAGYLTDGNEGAAWGAMLANPAALKYSIMAGKIPINVVQGIVQRVTGSKALNDAAIKKTTDFLKTPEGQAMMTNLGLGQKIVEKAASPSEAIQRRASGR